ncbi:hypothetical protein V5799_013097 [Amblyomma americanum]|uniref:Uncharacterized protein n=1 Tax=Amblyomma americanum TaxID=6943 RepID=A0AAQ4E705_AMBAM
MKEECVGSDPPAQRSRHSGRMLEIMEEVAGSVHAGGKDAGNGDAERQRLRFTDNMGIRSQWIFTKTAAVREKLHPTSKGRMEWRMMRTLLERQSSVPCINVHRHLLGALMATVSC